MPQFDEFRFRPAEARHAHLIGIGGAGMRAMASVLAGSGWRVSGCDVSDQGSGFRVQGATPLSPLGRGVGGEGNNEASAADCCTLATNAPHPAAGTATLSPGGRGWAIGHSVEHLRGVDRVVVSDAVPPTCEELVAARARGIPTFTYAQLLGALMRQRHGIAIAGTHGKSTVTAMLAHVLSTAGLDPTVLCGATPLGGDNGGRAGGGPWMIAEACEFRRNFLHLRPRLAAILNVEPDHFDCYPNDASLAAAFAEFAAHVPAGGVLAFNGDCQAAAHAASHCRARAVCFSVAGREDAEWSVGQLTLDGGCPAFQVRHAGRVVGDVRLRVWGQHQVANALAAFALAWEAGVAEKDIARGLSTFPGLRRRLEWIGDLRGAAIIDDYAHHPTEVSAGLAAARAAWPGRRLCCVFQPHQAQRTTRLLDEFARALQNADCVWVAEVFRAREGPPAAGEATAADLACRIAGLARASTASGPCVGSEHQCDAIKQRLMDQLGASDVLLVMGAGDIDRLSRALVQFAIFAICNLQSAKSLNPQLPKSPETHVLPRRLRKNRSSQ